MGLQGRRQLSVTMAAWTGSQSSFEMGNGPATINAGTRKRRFFECEVFDKTKEFPAGASTSAVTRALIRLQSHQKILQGQLRLWKQTTANLKMMSQPPGVKDSRNFS